MKQDKVLQIGLFGFGVVGEGIYKVLQQTPSLQANIKKVCIKHADKERNAPSDLFTTEYTALLNDQEIDLIVELIDDANEAYKIVSTALRNKKSVVSANKKMIAEHLQELIALQNENGVSFLYEAAVCGSIPIIRNLEEYYDNDLLQSICGIVNGSTNYILTKIIEEGLTYQEALLKAQQLGFAESNPALDVEGWDATNKLTILLAHAYGILSTPAELLHLGINRLHNADTKFAEEKGYQVKLTAQAYKLSNGKVAAFVLPQFVKSESQLFAVKNEYNGVIIESKLADKQFLYGKGAGRYPTSSAVISDISALTYDYKYEYKKLNRKEKYSLCNSYYLKVFVSFNNWSEVNKWDFEQVSEFHSTEDRQYLLGLIHIEKLRSANWFNEESVSVILLPNSITEKEAIISSSLKKVSLQLAGLN
ncbi:MAG TPA: homoserine dehydrogenase [Flavisolibacter sp.]|nr:homoserine dehydrogenase [Flavisolibacter sp.]